MRQSLQILPNQPLAKLQFSRYDPGPRHVRYDDRPLYGSATEITTDRQQDDQSLKENTILDAVLGILLLYLLYCSTVQ
jgi:hypothetical protein